MPIAWLLLGYVLCVESIHPLSGVPYPPFYRLRGAGITVERKSKKLEVEKVLRRSRVFLSPRVCPADMTDHVRDCVFSDLHRAMPWPHPASGYVPSYIDGQCGVLGSRAVTLRGVDGEVTIRLSL